MISHDEIKAKALEAINDRWMLRWRLGSSASGVAGNIATAILDDNARYMSTGATEAGRQMMTERVGERTKVLCSGFGFDPITLFLIGILLNAVIRIVIDWWFSKQAELAKQEH